MRKNNWTFLLIDLVLIYIALLWSFNHAMASECIKCHTDKDKLQSITKNLPIEEKSTETAGKG